MVLLGARAASRSYFDLRRADVRTTHRTASASTRPRTTTTCSSRSATPTARTSRTRSTTTRACACARRRRRRSSGSVRRGARNQLSRLWLISRAVGAAPARRRGGAVLRPRAWPARASSPRDESASTRLTGRFARRQGDGGLKMRQRALNGHVKGCFPHPRRITIVPHDRDSPST